jgi:hypothetical protein
MHVMLTVVVAISPSSPISGDIRRFTKAKRTLVPEKRRSNFLMRPHRLSMNLVFPLFGTHLCRYFRRLWCGIAHHDILFPDGILADFILACVPCITVPDV